MGRLLVRYRDTDAIRWGELEGNAPRQPNEVISVLPLACHASATSEVILALDQTDVKREPGIEVLANQLLSPVTNDAQIFAQGLNYVAHASEAQHTNRKSNLIFTKASSAITGPYGDVVRPSEVQLLDYEVEFGLVLRRDLGEGQEVTDTTIGDVVAGVVLCNDVSARDTMFGETFIQWYRGKSYRTFCPTGPALWLLERNEVRDTLHNLEIKLWVNGELRQSANSQQLIWKPAESLSYIASSIDMRCGDLLLTGTPGGVTAPATPRMVEILKTHLFADDLRRDELRTEMSAGRPFLQPGDLVTATLADSRGLSLGGLANKIVEAGHRG
jgi:2-keto-4-pentenoate hydratase/2-oxohepta-3-ene-1,7-dioic acid hydratase in catechol pathway